MRFFSVVLFTLAFVVLACLLNMYSVALDELCNTESACLQIVEGRCKRIPPKDCEKLREAHENHYANPP